jgi:hypothetical protein
MASPSMGDFLDNDCRTKGVVDKPLVDMECMAMYGWNHQIIMV